MTINLGKNFEQLPKILAFYDEEYAAAADAQKLAGRTMEDICKKNPSILGYYEERAVELKHILEYMEMRVDEVRGKLFQGYKKGSNVAMTEREIQQYIKSDSAFIAVNIKMLEVKEMYDKFNAAVNCFKNIGYAMNNLTKLIVAQAEGHTL